MGGLSIGVDVGGTFTDIVAWDADSGEFFNTKVPSTPPVQEEGVVDGIQRILDTSGRSPAEIERIVHGTTVGLNAVLEKKGAKLGLLTTDGFQGTLAIGRQLRSKLYDLNNRPETPTFLCPRRRIFGISERTEADGAISEALNEQEVERALDALVGQGVDAIAVCFVNAFANPAHELRVGEIITARFPDLRVSLSSQVDPRFREYERLCVTAFDAYVKPVTERYVRALQDRISSAGINSRLQIMQCRGGITDARSIIERPVSSIKSGAAAGVVGGNFAGALAGHKDLITVDIGGTSCDISLIRDSELVVASEGMIETYPLRQPMVDVQCIGAGGGSIAWIDAAGGFRVGPQSAGARPGPASYGTGGEDATVTDASILLGYLDPATFGYGTIKLDASLAQSAVARFSGTVGMDAQNTALGIHQVINTQMAEAIRLISVGRGFDPRRFSLVALGGAGAVHAGRLAELLHIRTVIVPPSPGTLSALGLLVADFEHEHAATHCVALDGANIGELEAAFEQVEKIVTARMREDGIPEAGLVTRRLAEMRYRGQSYEIDVPVPNRALAPQDLKDLAAEFHRRHQALFSHSDPAASVEIANVRVVQSYSTKGPEARTEKTTGCEISAAILAERPALFDSKTGYVEVPVYSREKLPVGSSFAGPAIVQQSDTTVVVYPKHTVAVDKYHNLIISVPTAQENNQ